jgi:hypothetical protein
LSSQKKAKISTTKLNLKAPNIYIKPLLKPYNMRNKPCFETAYLGKNVINLLKQRVAIILGYFVLSKNHNEPPKVAQLAKNCPIWALFGGLSAAHFYCGLTNNQGVRKLLGGNLKVVPAKFSALHQAVLLHCPVRACHSYSLS